MNPSGYRMEEKKSPDLEAKSTQSYKSTQSTRSSVLQRAREYNRRIEDEHRQRRTKSLERPVSDHSQSQGTRSKSVSRVSTRERAMATVRKETAPAAQPTSSHQRNPTSPSSRSLKSREEPQPQAIVTPELLVDALSGHEDGLLAICERLMEHYDAGYDVMGEAIIDAFADVQKLFQHVVEAAHMEGAAFEASRRQEEIAALKRQIAQGGETQSLEENRSIPAPATPNSANLGRHDEFIDQDVKDVLAEAIRKGQTLRDQNKYMECYELYEKACQDASALLPVDSDHRGRLQLSIARAESMSADRACAILRYAMDDVLRSSQRAQKTPMPDPSKRADVVLQRPKAHPSVTGANGQVVQSAQEALNSIMEEMKEILGAPVYDDTPLQDVAKRFWAALEEAQKTSHKNEQKLEDNLAKLKGEYLLARAEWEEKLTQSNETADTFKQKYDRLKEQMRGEQYMDQARSFVSRVNNESMDDSHPGDVSAMYSSAKSNMSGRAGSVASRGSELMAQAKTIVKTMNQFNCQALNERNEPVDETEETRDSDLRRNDSSSQAKSKVSKSFREYSKSPKRMDV